MQDSTITSPTKGSQKKFVFGGILIIAAIILLIITNTRAGAQYFLTVDEIKERQEEITGKDIRVSGAVLGDTIEYDTENLIIKFEVAHVPGDNKEIDAQGGLAMVLHQAVINPDANRIFVVYEGVMPDLLQNEAQAIMTGKIGEDGIFYASELLLKCPTKYEEAVPEQSANS
ncbi:MAG: cytochrome c maturation protein CcmE [Anaerolineaceae bacterium]|nr:cytochrome c maturation protein CcmE [Anaerolineaceae bacterium]